MRSFKLMTTAAVVAVATSLALGAPATAVGTTSDSVYSFDLGRANTAVSLSGGQMASPGDWISVRGSGTFDPTAKTVKAKGSFVHYDSSGTVACTGTWKATAFTSFLDFGADDQGEEGGVLSIVVSHYCKTMGMTMTAIPMTVTSTVSAPTGSSYIEGTTVADFTQPTGGTVVIQPEQ